MTNTASTRHRGHPITVAAAEMREVLDGLTEVSTWSMSPEQTRATLPELTRLKARVAELELRVAAHGEMNKIGDDSGATSTVNWWAHTTEATRAAAHRDVRLAKALDTDAHEPVRRALAVGEVVVDQAAVTGHAPEPGQPTAHKMGSAFQEYIESYPAAALPKAGGVNATVVVTMTLEALLGGLKAAQLDTGENITAGEARRLACQAGVIPAVLDGQSKVLDLGRKRRFHSEAQRIVATLEQGGCTAEGCDRPPGMSHLHHPTPWSQGGGTNRDGRLLCPRHHTLAHDLRYQMTVHPTGKVSFPPTQIGRPNLWSGVAGPPFR